jgi:hypothetical protein
VIGGYAVQRGLQEEALDWARRFMELHLTHYPEWEGEVELRQMYEEPSPSA